VLLVSEVSISRTNDRQTPVLVKRLPIQLRGRCRTRYHPLFGCPHSGLPQRWFRRSAACGSIDHADVAA
jgi:hypothetical protein